MLSAVAAVLLLTSTGPAPADDQRQTTVGMPARIDQIVLPGPELEASPLEDSRSPIVLRITNVFQHGSAYRYDMVYYGLEPGRFDLRDYLRRKDGSSTDDLPEIPVEVRPVLPPGQIEPNQLETQPAPRLGGYRLTLAVGIVAWLACMLAILLVGRRKRRTHAEAGERALSLADRLRPMVEAAIAGHLTLAQRAELERMLLAYWRRRLDLDGMKPAEAIAKLRDHADAGQLLGALETWLHRPPGTVAKVDVAEFLKPYQTLPAEA